MRSVIRSLRKRKNRALSGLDEWWLVVHVCEYLRCSSYEHKVNQNCVERIVNGIYVLICADSVYIDPKPFINRVTII